MGFLLGNQAGWEVGWVRSLQLEGCAGEGCTPERAPGFRGQGHRDAGEGNGPKSRGWCLQEPQVSLQNPPCLFRVPTVPGTCGQASDKVLWQVTAHLDLAAATFGCHAQVPVASGPATCTNDLHLPSHQCRGPNGVCDEEWVVGSV